MKMAQRLVGVMCALAMGMLGGCRPRLMAATSGDRAMTMQLHSDAFATGQPIPKKFTGDGTDVSPPLSWQNVPASAREFALICDDPDAPSPQPWVHWVIYKIPAEVRQLPEGVPPEKTLASPPGARQGHNSWNSGRMIGYRGPLPPPGHGVHHYHFRLYALDHPLDLPAGAEKKELIAAMSGHIVGEGELLGTYQR